MHFLKSRFSGRVAAKVLAAAGLASAGELPSAKPEQVGMSSQRLGLITERLKADIAARKLPSAVVLVARHGKVAYFESLGKLDPAADAPMAKAAAEIADSLNFPRLRLSLNI